MNNCLRCGAATRNPSYCGRSCAATHTNQQAPKRKPQGCCQECGAAIHANRRYCARHRPAKTSRSEYYGLTIAEFKVRNAHLHPSYYRGHLNTLTRLLNAHRPRICQACGYDRHVEYCHVRPLKAFSATATIAEISGPANIHVLCPNCHWEYDHGLLRVDPAGFQPAV